MNRGAVDSMGMTCIWITVEVPENFRDFSVSKIVILGESN